MTLRYRAQGGLLAGKTIYERAYNGSITFTTTECEQGQRRYMYDEVVPRFFKRQKAGEVFFNSLWSEDMSRFSAGTGWSVTDTRIGAPNNVWTLDGSAARYIVNAAGHLPVLSYDGMWLLPLNELDALKTEIATGVRANRGKVVRNNGYETLGEMGKTVAMLRHPIKTFINFDKKFGRRVWKTAAQAWLAYRYGVMPLVSSIKACNEELRKIRPRNERITTRNSGSTTYSDTITKTLTVGAIKNLVVTTTRHHTVTGRAMSLDEHSVSLQDQLGLSVKDMVTVPWEFVPYSFVVDWFVNVGDYFSALAPVPGVKQLGSCMSFVSDIRWTSVISGGTPSQAYYLLNTIPSGYVDSQLTGKNRTPLAAAGLVVKSNFRLTNPIRIGDGLALVAMAIDARFGHAR